MKRVLFWTQHFWPYIGGVEVIGSRLPLALRERGYAFVVVTSHGALDLPDEDTYEGIPIYRLPFHRALAGRDVGAIARARREVVRIKGTFGPDLVHLHLADASVLFHLETADVSPAPLLLSLHVAPPERGGGSKSLLGACLRTAGWVTAPSAAILGDARRLAPEIGPRSSVMHGGMARPALSPGPLPWDPPRLLCVGRLVDDKGFDLALAAFAAIAERWPTTRLAIAGDGPARGELERQAANLGIQDRVEFVGWVEPPRLPALIDESTMVVMPSRWREAFGLVALEAAMMARPVVATRVGGIPEVVEDGRTGLLVEREDVAALAQAIEYLLEHREVAVEMGRAARSRATRLFDWERFVDTHDQLYRQLTGDVADAQS